MPPKTAKSKSNIVNPRAKGHPETSRNSVKKSGEGGVPQIQKSPINNKTALRGIVSNIAVTPVTERV